MRIVMSDNSATNSCGTYSYGETEDYTVNITVTAAARIPRRRTAPARATDVAYEYIDLVQLGSIDRTSAADGGYYNVTASSTSIATDIG